MRRILFAALLAIAALPAGAQWWGGKPPERITFVLCIGTDCTTGSNLTSPWISLRAGKITVCKAVAKTAPVGAAILIDVLRNRTSMFGDSKLAIADGSTAVATKTSFANQALVADDLVTVDITQVGTITKGKDLSVVCKVE